jgi:hypothetical protein
MDKERARPDGNLPPVAEGTFLVYRLFEVGEDIDLARAESLLRGEGERLRLAPLRDGLLDLPDPPLTVPVGRRPFGGAGGPGAEAEVHVRLYAHGVASVRYEVPIPSGAGAPELAALVKGASEDAALVPAARAEVRAVAARVAAAVRGPLDSPLHETYAIVQVRAFAGGAALPREPWRDVARVLAGEPPSTDLAPETVEHITRRRFSWTAADLCVIDWDTALVVEPSGDRAVADVLDVAAAQLLEFRYYDALFEGEMIRVTEMLGRPRASLAWLFVGRYSEVTRRVQHLVVESAEFVERVENAVRVVGDLYLARVYRAAVERFRVPAWEADVLRRQQTAVQVAGLLRSEANAALGHVLEGSIIALIVIEIGMALW